MGVLASVLVEFRMKMNMMLREKGCEKLIEGEVVVLKVRLLVFVEKANDAPLMCA